MSLKSKAKYFPTAAQLRSWFELNHESASELWVGYYKKSTGRPSITWADSVDEALCFGWIDGIRKSIDAARYRIRFTPRKSTSIWSAINMRRARALLSAGRMKERGKTAFAARKENRSGIYAYEQRSIELPPPYARRMKANKAAWKDFGNCPPSYRKTVHWWVVSPKQEATRLRRLDQLIACHAAGQRLPQYSWKKTPPAEARRRRQTT